VYAIWAGVGTAAVAMIGVAAFGEPMDAVKALSVLAVMAGVVGLNLSGAH
jgi:small multidrug resistance pump